MGGLHRCHEKDKAKPGGTREVRSGVARATAVAAGSHAAEHKLARQCRKRGFPVSTESSKPIARSAPVWECKAKPGSTRELAYLLEPRCVSKENRVISVPW